MSVPAIFGFYGSSNTGKTTLIVKIIEKLAKEGYKVATIKKTDKKIGIDKKEKDTWKHGQAGAKLVVFSSPCETDFIVKENMKTKDIIQIYKGLSPGYPVSNKIRNRMITAINICNQ